VTPELKGKFTGMAFRVPTSTVSVVDGLQALLTALRDLGYTLVRPASREGAPAALPRPQLEAS